MPSYIPGGIPLRIGHKSAGGTGSGSNVPRCDLMIGGVPFNGAWDANTPYARETAQQQKQQFDASQDPGEQTLSTWWLRSQSSWHGGAGQEWFEPAATDDDQYARIRFDDSYNMDVWTKGQLSALNEGLVWDNDTHVVSGIDAFALGVHDNKAVIAVPSGLMYVTLDPPTFDGTSDMMLMSDMQAFCMNGDRWYCADNTYIYSGHIGDSVNDLQWTLPSGTDVCLAWVKARLMCFIDNKVYEVVEAGSTTSPPTLAGLRYTHPDDSWRWIAAVDGPNSIIAAGLSGPRSELFSFGLTQGDPPVVAPGVSIAVLPSGETAAGLCSFVGSFLAIGTSRGVRIGTFSQPYGDFTYGPLSYESTSPVKCLTSKGSYVYAGTAGGAVRLDVGFPVDRAGRVAWANDIVCDPVATNTAAGIGAWNNASRLVMLVPGTGLCIEQAAPGSIASWLRTSRIRFDTLEPKFFKWLQAWGDGWPNGVFRLWVRTDADPDTDILLLTWTHQDGPPGQVKLPPAARTWIQLTLGISDSTSDAVLQGWQVKALPASKKERLIQYPLLCFDSEKDRNDVQIGYPGWALDRLSKLEEMDSSGQEVVVSVDYGLRVETFTAVVESVSYRQSQPFSRTDHFGGVLVVTVRTT